MPHPTVGFDGSANLADQMLSRLMTIRPGSLCTSASLWVYDKTAAAPELLSYRSNHSYSTPEDVFESLPRTLLLDMHRHRRTNAFAAPVVYRDIDGNPVLVFFGKCSDGRTSFITLRHQEDVCYSQTEMAALQFVAETIIYSIRMLHSSEELQRKARLDEQRRIARDLHDTMVQDATGAVLQLQNATLSLAASESSQENVDPNVTEAQRYVLLASLLTRRLMERLRKTMWHLHGAGEKPSTEDIFSAETENFTQRALVASRRVLTPIAHRTAIHFEVVGEEENVPHDISREMCHILTEVLTNVVRHAKATRVRIVLTFQDSALKLSVTDNGCGFDMSSRPAKPHPDGCGFGLMGMRGRVETLCGNISLTSHIGKGTHVRVTVPLSPQSRELH
ncbi:MAG: sensor histidine kinase [Akkermansiaceae bacterium]|nr:sensor histidine kinase [Armatimonadota bacterium]